MDETVSVSSYVLVEELIDFGTAIDDRDYVKAMQILEGMEFSPQSEAMWLQLQSMCVDNWNLKMAERCSAALGDVSRARYLHKVAKLADAAKEQGVDPRDHWQVRSKMLELKKELEMAEDVLIAHNKVDDAILMYEDLLLFNEALEVAERRNHPEAEDKRRKFYQYLLDSKQEEAAALMKEREGEHVQAINLYLQAGMPGKAARVIADNNINQPSNLLESVAIALEDSDMYEKAGDFYERMGQKQRALEGFIKGHAFRKAVELARKHFPNQVVSLEESWGDYLVSVSQLDMAINHYMEAHAQSKAINAALKARQWSKALNLADQLDVDSAKPYYAELAEHYASQKQYKEAERCYVQSDNQNKAVDMWTSAGEWEQAHRLARTFLPESEITTLYMENANKMEKAQKFKEAEKLYLAVDKPDHAIAMYKRHRKFETMIQLVGKYRKELLGESHKYLAQQLEMEGNLRDAGECAARDQLRAAGGGGSGSRRLQHTFAYVRAAYSPALSTSSQFSQRSTTHLPKSGSPRSTCIEPMISGKKQLELPSSTEASTLVRGSHMHTLSTSVAPQEPSCSRNSACSSLLSTTLWRAVRSITPLNYQGRHCPRKFLKSISSLLSIWRTKRDSTRQRENLFRRASPGRRSRCTCTSRVGATPPGLLSSTTPQRFLKFMQLRGRLQPRGRNTRGRRKCMSLRASPTSRLPCMRRRDNIRTP